MGVQIEEEIERKYRMDISRAELIQLQSQSELLA